MLRVVSSVIGLAIAMAMFVGNVSAKDFRSYDKTKDYDELTAAEHTAAKATAAKATIKTLRACADPGNMPLSNNKGEGFQNKIIALLAKSLGGEVQFFWRPYLERGLTRETFENNECDVLLDMPSDSELLLTTEPIYRSTYVLAYRNDTSLDIKTLDDPRLKRLRVGVFQHSGVREALQRRGVSDNVDVHIITPYADLDPSMQPWRQVQRVLDKELDLAAVWGPFAGWLVTMKKEPLSIVPVNVMEDQVPMEFELSIGMKKSDVILKYMLDRALQENREAIGAILAEYGVPLVNCSRCAVQGNLPSHGSYMHKLRGLSNVEDRFLKQAAPRPNDGTESKDQHVDQARLEKWLADGADIHEELHNAIIANDAQRLNFLISKGANVNGPDKLGFLPLHQAARSRLAPFIALLAKAGADPNARDSDGYTPLMHAINRNHVPSIQALASAGANLELTTAAGITPLSLALGDGQLYAARALVELGADVNSKSGAEGVTPLMTVATVRAAKSRAGQVTQGLSSIDVAKILVAKGAQVNGLSKAGVSPLMVAAGHNNAQMIGYLLSAGADGSLKSADGATALDIAKRALADDAIGALKFLAQPVSPAAPTAAN